MIDKNIKIKLKEIAINKLTERIDFASDAMRTAQDAANNEDKSTVGDKHETSRSMALLDREIHARQLDSAQKELNTVQHIDVTILNTSITNGSYVETDNGNYFFLAGLGPIETEFGKMFFISINSPIGKIFQSKKTGESVIFNGNKFLIKRII